MEIIEVSLPQIISNSLFYSIAFSMAAFTRFKIIRRNHFGTQLTPLCKLILKYEATYKTPYRNPIIAYFIISAITTVGFEAINKKISYIEELPWKSYFGKYGNNLSYAANPVIFCGIFKVPLVSGIIMGMISKGLQDNIFDRYRELISD